MTQLSYLLPQKSENIYPKNEENVAALLSRYFDEYDIPSFQGIEIIMKKTSLALNQVEYIVQKIAHAVIPVFQKHLKAPEISNLLSYGFEVFSVSEEEYKGSKPRVEILKELEEFILMNK